MTSIFVDDYANLPSSAPADHPHLIDTKSCNVAETAYNEEVDEKLEGPDVKIWDAVATMLFKISEAAFKKFMAGDTKKFQLVQNFKDSKCMATFVIERRGNKVGHYWHVKEEHLFDFDTLVWCTINFDGSWRIDDASCDKATPPRLIDVWNKKFVHRGFGKQNNAADQQGKAELAGALARSIVSSECWDAAAGSQWRIKMT